MTRSGAAELVDTLCALGAEVVTRPDGGTLFLGPAVLGRGDAAAGMRALVQHAPQQCVVLGSLAVQAADRVSEHDSLGRLVVRLNLTRLIVVGSDARPLAAGAWLEGSYGDEVIFTDSADAIDLTGLSAAVPLWVAGGNDALLRDLRRVVEGLRHGAERGHYGGARLTTQDEMNSRQGEMK